jgi:hypothetical protein
MCTFLIKKYKVNMLTCGYYLNKICLLYFIRVVSNFVYIFFEIKIVHTIDNAGVSAHAY